MANAIFGLALALDGSAVAFMRAGIERSCRAPFRVKEGVGQSWMVPQVGPELERNRLPKYLPNCRELRAR